METTYDPSLPRIVPLKTVKERELFHKWRHVLSQKRVSDETVRLYNKDLQEFLKSDEGRRYKETIPVQ